MIVSLLPNRQRRVGAGRFPLWVVALMLAVIASVGAGCAASALEPGGDYAGIELDPPLAIPDVVLTDTSGNPYDLRQELAGRIGLVYFGYTSCPDICPVHLAQIDSVLAMGDQPTNVEVVLITVDPERDDAATLRRFLDQFDRRFVGLLGTPEQLADAQRAFGLAVAAKEGDGDDYTFGHAGQVFAFAPDGYAYTVYPQGTRQSHWADDLPKLAQIQPAEDSQ